MDSEKRQELRTYRKLQLGREHKSRARRDAVSDKGIFMFIGGKTPDRPYLKVLKSEYHRIWRETESARRKSEPNSVIDTEKGADLNRVHLEELIYDQLLKHAEELQSLEESFEKKHGRKMTAHEVEMYSSVLKKEDGAIKSPIDRAAVVRKFLVNGVIDSIKSNQKKDPSKLQHAWASVVGPDLAMDTLLEKVDPEKGVAYCRTLSSSQVHILKRKRDLPRKLGKLLGMNITRISFR